MRKVKIVYKDGDSQGLYRDAEFETGYYTPERAAKIQECLHVMGCHSFRLEPLREAENDTDKLAA